LSCISDVGESGRPTGERGYDGHEAMVFHVGACWFVGVCGTWK
jgi:hypothetical protein